MNAPDRAWVLAQTETLARFKSEDEADEIALLIFTESVERGESEEARKAYFGPGYQFLKDTYDAEHQLCEDCGNELEGVELKDAKRDDCLVCIDCRRLNARADAWRFGPEAMR